MIYPITSHSWTVINESQAIKKLDKSAFLHSGTAIPKGIFSFFNLLERTEHKATQILLFFEGIKYQAEFKNDSFDRFRLFWKADFDKLLNKKFTIESKDYQNDLIPKIKTSMVFSKNSKNSFEIEFLSNTDSNSQKQASQRNPNWVRDEVILALDLYFREPNSHGNSSHPEVIKLSDFLNSLDIHSDKKLDNFRNPNGIGMKLSNFRALDPNQESSLTNISKIDQQIWKEFSSDTQYLKKIASAIYSLSATPSTMDEKEDEIANEGKILTRVHKIRERNSQLVKKKKQSVFKKHSKLKCEICGFDYQKFYGPRGENFAECHHTKPISELSENDSTKLSDLAIVCANCHRMIHKSRPWLSINELKEITAQASK